MEKIKSKDGSMINVVNINIFVVMKVQGITTSYIGNYDINSLCLFFKETLYSLSSTQVFKVYGLLGDEIDFAEEIKSINQDKGFVSSLFLSKEEQEKAQYNKLKYINKLTEKSIIYKEIYDVKSYRESLGFFNKMNDDFKKDFPLLIEKRIKRISSIYENSNFSIKDFSGEDIYCYLTTPYNYINMDNNKRNIIIRNSRVIQEWEFSYENKETNINLINIIKTKIIPSIKDHAKNNYWLEQCILYELKNCDNIDLDWMHKNIHEQNKYSYDIAKELIKKDGDFRTLSYLVRACIYHKKMDESVYYAKMGYDKFITDGKNRKIFYRLLLKALNNRNAKVFTCQGINIKNKISDAQYALNLMLKNFDKKEINELKDLVYKILPSHIIKEEDKINIFKSLFKNAKDLHQGVQNIGVNIGTKFGGRKSNIPYDKNIIESMPDILDFNVVSKELKKDKNLSKEYENIIIKNNQNLSDAIIGSSAGVSMLWTYSQIDDSVLNALSFASKGNPTDFFELQNIARDMADNLGAITRLKGYVAEQQVALELAQSGQQVEFPKSANQEGYDLLVNNEPYQVKNSLDANYVESHFDTYPDIPVFVNSELAEKFADNPMVIPMDNVSFYHIQEITESSLEALERFASITDYLPIPILSVAFASYNNLGDLRSNRINVKEYAKNVATETVVKTGSAAAGAKAGAFIGSTVFGPVGTGVGAIVGGTIGASVGSTGVNAFNKKELCDQRDVVVSELIAFAKWFGENLVKSREKFAWDKVQEKIKFAQACEETSGISSQFFAYQFENYIRFKEINEWFDYVQKSDDEELKINAGWIALNLSGHFVSVEMNRKIQRIQAELEKYENILNPKKEDESGDFVTSFFQILTDKAVWR